MKAFGVFHHISRSGQQQRQDSVSQVGQQRTLGKGAGVWQMAARKVQAVNTVRRGLHGAGTDNDACGIGKEAKYDGKASPSTSKQAHTKGQKQRRRRRMGRAGRENPMVVAQLASTGTSKSRAA